MVYEDSLHFLQSTLQKCRVQTLLLTKEQYTDIRLDSALREQLGFQNDYAAFFAEHLAKVKPNTVYKLSDSFLLHYLFLQLPDDGRVLFIGPYLEEEAKKHRLLELAERTGLTPLQASRLETLYSSISILDAYHAVFAMVDTFGETIWGNEKAFSLVDINRENAGDLTPLTTPLPQDDTVHAMSLLETRYAYENELIEAVSQGLTHKAELMLAGFSQAAFEQRLTDPIRNLKNYGIIMNTLLRKAAEKGGVHPLYLDKTSTAFARRNELCATVTDVRNLMTDMFRSYCRLVKTHAHKQYSPPIQKTIALIDSDLAGELNLHTLANAQGLNAGYLSALFHRETGETLTEHITRKRIQQAMYLLNNTHLQIQTIAQHCGIPDVNYFSKLFKKHAGKTPREYRNENR